MTKPEMSRKDDVEARLDKLMSEMALLKENVIRSDEKVTQDAEYIRATVRSDISQLRNDLLFLKTNQHKIEEKITTLENIINNLAAEMRILRQK